MAFVDKFAFFSRFWPSITQNLRPPSCVHMAASPRALYWVVTENVEPAAFISALEIEGLPDGVTYLCGQFEQGTHLHFQGYVELQARQRVTWLKKNLTPTAHLDRRRGTQAEAIHYTSKPHDGCNCAHCVAERANPTAIPGTWVEFGEKTKEKPGKRNDIWDAKALIDDGEPEEVIADRCFPAWLRYHKDFTKYRLLKSPKRIPAEGVEILIYYGDTGLGKSRLARESFPDAFVKSVGGKWFDGYEGQHTVIFDEFGGNWMPFGTLLAITDRYDCRVDIKGVQCRFSARRLVFTTNRHPRFWYRGQDHYYPALMRRITKIVYFEKDEDPRESVYPFDDIPETDFGAEHMD